MSFKDGDRVRMVRNPAQLGTVTGERDHFFTTFIGVQWMSGDFGFVAPANLAPDAPTAIPGMTAGERVALGEAYRSALDAVDPIGFVTATNTLDQNRTETGTDMAEPGTEYRDFDPEAIQRRITDCATYNFGMRNANKLAHDDAPTMLAYIHKLEHRLGINRD